MRFSNFNRGRDRWKVVAALVLVCAAVVGLLAIVGDPLALPTTSEKMVHRDLLGIRPAGGLQVGAATVKEYDCKVGPSWARRTLRIPGDRTHAELMARRALTAAGWSTAGDEDARRDGVDLESKYDISHVRSSVVEVEFTNHGPSVDATITVLGTLGQACGVD